MWLRYLGGIVLLMICSMFLGSTFAQELPQPTVLDLAWHPNENWLSVADTEGLRLMDTTNREILRSFPVDSSPIYAVAWSPDGSRLASGGVNGELKVWDPATGNLLANLVGHSTIINALAWNLDGSRLSSSSVQFDGVMLRIWDMTNYQQVAEKPAGFITRLVWSHNSQQIFVSIRNGGGAWAIDALSTLVSPLTHEIDPTNYFDGIAIDIHPTSNLIAVGAANGNIYLVDTELNQTIMTLSGHTDYVTRIKWSRDGAFLTSVSIDGTIKTWDALTGQLLGNFAQENVLYAVAISPDGTQLAYGGENMGGDGNSVPIIDISDYILTATPYSGAGAIGTAGTALSIHFELRQ